MTIVNRLRLLTAALGVAAASAAVVTTVLGDVRSDRSPSATPARPTVPDAVADETAKTRYTDLPALAYKLGSGETVFAWQVKPTLPAATARPRDVLVLVDTSASQAGAQLARARNLVTALATSAGADDRIDLWTVNIDNAAATRSLTGGFQPANADPVHAAVARLADAEYGSGAVDLKAGLEKAARAFEGRGGRNQVLLYLGDGESAASKAPLTEAGRVELGRLLADRQVGFFAVPLGVKVHGQNLHGLAAMTGGTVVRMTDDPVTAQGRVAAADKLKAAFDVPVLRPERVTFGPAGLEVFPTRLPPLRADRTTLVVGTLKEFAQTVSARVEGRVNGNKVTVDLSEKLPAPVPENYFLAAMVQQWRDAPAKDAPAVLPADRTLAMAAEQFRLFRDEFAVLAVQAISSDRLDHAEKLFQAAARIDPESPEVRAGMKVLARVRGGELKTEKVKAWASGGAKLDRALTELAQAPAPQPPVPGAQPPVPPAPGGPVPTPPPGATPAQRDAIAQARAAQAVLEAEFRTLVDDTLRRARRLLYTDPDASYEDLKRQRDAVLANDQLSAAFRNQLVRDLEASMREVQLGGAEIKRQLEAQRARIAQARQRLNEFDRLVTQEEATRARIQAFKELMSQARFELAQQEAQVMIGERVSRGLPVPPEAVAAYRIGQSATNLREWKELVRLREDRYLLAMMQTEKSFIPYPDEPPVHFPPAAVWRELTAGRVQKYGTMSLGENAPPSFERLRSVLEGEVDKRVMIQNLSTVPSLDALLTTLQQQFAEYGVRFVYRSDLFPPDFRPGETKLRTTSDLTGLPLGSFLDTVLRDVEMSWIARPEYIEIGPNTVTSSLRYQEKVTRVFDVADLIIGIPQSVNPATLYSSIQFQGAFMTIFGSSFVPQFGFNGNGVNPFGGGGFGGAGGANNPFFGGMQGMPGGGGLAMGGGGGLGGPFGGAGQLGAQGIQGGAGFAGVQGGLAGQFGIQGNDQSQFLVQLIVSTVARGEWDLQMVGGAQQPLFGVEEIQNFQPLVEQKDLNSIGFYPPARALVVRGSHRYHLAPSFKLRRGDQMGAGGPGLPRDGGLAKANPKADRPAGAAGGVAPAAAPAGNKTGDVVGAVQQLIGKTGTEPEKMWNKVFEQKVTNPRLIADAIDVLYEAKEYGHSAEALKAALRRGRLGGGVVHEALALVLQAGQAAPAEVERAALSGIDLEPADAGAYLRAARYESDAGQHEVALAYCQRAAALEPNMPTPYANALAYAEKATDVKTDAVHWASVNLLRRDWPADGIDYHGETKNRLGRIAKKLAGAGRKGDADKLQTVATGEKTRDLVVELLWQGNQSDLDLVVIEPAGSVCSATHKRTAGGGVLKSDLLAQGEERSEVYTNAQAFAGKYTLSVNPVLGTKDGRQMAIGNRATLKVVKYQGTDKETVEVHSVNLADPRPVEVKLETGTRTELATVPVEENTAQLSTTQALRSPYGSSGIAAGAGGSSGGSVTNPVSGQAALPAVSPTVETRVPGIAAGMPGLRVEAQISADRKNVVLNANPVFTGPARDLPRPKLNILPGGE